MVTGRCAFHIILTMIFCILNITCINASSDSLQHKNETSEQLKAKGAYNYNVIIIFLDTLRADHLGCYGYPKDTSPNIDKLAKRGILFEWAIAQSSFTSPSSASLFTSKYVSTHKLDSIEKKLANNELTLAEVLRDNGYKTAAFIYNAVQFNPDYGLNQGFDVYSFGENWQDDYKISFEKTMPEALSWITNNKNEAFFVFLHSNDIHAPYHSLYENFFDASYKGYLDKVYLGRRNPDFCESKNIVRTPREIKHIIAHYDGGIKYADSFIPKLTEKLEELKLTNKTIIILLSDHGEILADRGVRFLHGFSVHDEEVHVPLIIVHPGIKAKGIKIDSQVQLIDIMPTIFDFLDIDTENIRNMEGNSLVPLIKDIAKDDFNKYVYSECVKGESGSKGIVNREMMVRNSSWKLIASNWKIKASRRKIVCRRFRLYNGAILALPNEFKTNYELYNLKEDPKEINNLIDRKDEKIMKVKVEMLEELLSKF